MNKKYFWGSKLHACASVWALTLHGLRPASVYEEGIEASIADTVLKLP